MGRPKPLMAVGGRPLGQHAIDALAASGVGPVLVVVGARAERVRKGLVLPPGGALVGNLGLEEGRASSLRAGLAAAGDASAVVVQAAATTAPAIGCCCGAPPGPG